MDAVSLKEHFDRQIEALRRETDIKNEALQRELIKAEMILNRRLESMNEFRDALKDAQATYATQIQVIAGDDANERRVRELENQRAYIIGAAAAAATIVSLLIRFVNV